MRNVSLVNIWFSYKGRLKARHSCVHFLREIAALKLFLQLLVPELLILSSGRGPHPTPKFLAPAVSWAGVLRTETQALDDPCLRLLLPF